MSMSRSGSRLRVTALCLGAFALLYGGSFYTRDWRTAVPQGAHAVERSGVRAAVVAAPLARTAKLDEPLPRAAQPAARTEPDVTGAWRAVRTEPSIGRSYPDLVCSGNDPHECHPYDRRRPPGLLRR